jgi:hypothetical protein
MSRATLRELIEDLQVEHRKLTTLVSSLDALRNQWQREGSTDERVDAAALRLQSLYTGIERCLTQIVRVLNGGAPEGGDWHRRLLERMALPTTERPAVLAPATAAGLAELMRFRHVVRHLYAYELDASQVRRLLEGVPELWRLAERDLATFEGWLAELAATSG